MSIETKNFDITTTPETQDAPNAINETVEAFAVLGFGTPAGPTIHLQLGRDYPELLNIGAAVDPSNIKIIRRRVATLAMPAVTAEALANAILDTISNQRPK